MKDSIKDNQVHITLKLFAVYQETLGVPEKEMQLPTGTTVGEVHDRLIQAYPQLSQWKDLTRFGLNFQFVEANTPLADGDELVLIPPVSGG
ncbi:MAG: MoaD/ThiS family protein [Phormidesmis sp.]